MLLSEQLVWLQGSMSGLGRPDGLKLPSFFLSFFFLFLFKISFIYLTDRDLK